MDWTEKVRNRLERFAKVLNDGIGGMSDTAEDAAAADIRTALRHLDTLTGYVEGWKARAEKAEAEVARLRAAVRGLVEAGDEVASMAGNIENGPNPEFALDGWAEAKRAALRGGE